MHADDPMTILKRDDRGGVPRELAPREALRDEVVRSGPMGKPFDSCPTQIKSPIKLLDSTRHAKSRMKRVAA